ncbi:MAG: hypothetical protein ACOC9P_02280 [bacterium]
MPTPPPGPEKLQQAVDAVAEHGSMQAAAASIGLAPSTLRDRYRKAVERGYEAGPQIEPEAEQKVRLLEDRCRALEAQVRRQDKEEQLDRWIRNELFNLRSDPTPPGWVHAPGRMSKSSPGTPFLSLGDWHAGERVNPDEIDGLNEYDLEIFHRRAKHVVDKAVDLLKHHMVNPVYPGIVVGLLGDMVSGDIHKELQETNELATIPTVLDVVGVLRQSLEYLADHCGRVHVVCVVGNHGRNTQKMQAKQRTATSFDWLTYKTLELVLNGDSRITFQIPDSADTHLRIYDHQYLITHGDQFRGGDGIIGPLGPLVRGDYKKRLRQSMVDDRYDTLVTGHFHRLITLSQLITNGSLIGYNEYAFTNNLPYEPPQQAMWITHPENGITYTLPVRADAPAKRSGGDSKWVSVPAGFGEG